MCQFKEVLNVQNQVRAAWRNRFLLGVRVVGSSWIYRHSHFQHLAKLESWIAHKV